MIPQEKHTMSSNFTTTSTANMTNLFTSVSFTTGHNTESPPNTESFQLERTLIVSWKLLTAFLAILGNGTVLLTSIKYHAIRLDRVSIILIRNLAVSDLGFGLVILVTLVNDVEGRNMLGSSLCYIITMIQYFFLVVSSGLLSSLNCNKLMVLLFPLQSYGRSCKRGLFISASIWVSIGALQAGGVAANFLIDNIHIEFNKYNHRCVVVTTVASIPLAATFTVVDLLKVCLMLVPILVILITTIRMFWFVTRVRGIQRHGVLTLLGVSVTYCFSFAPCFVFYVMKVVMREEVQVERWFKTFQMIVPLAICINFAANPLIYCLTIRSFGRFLKMKLHFASNKMSSTVRATRVVRYTSRLVSIMARDSSSLSAWYNNYFFAM